VVSKSTPATVNEWFAPTDGYISIWNINFQCCNFSKLTLFSCTFFSTPNANGRSRWSATRAKSAGRFCTAESTRRLRKIIDWFLKIDDHNFLLGHHGRRDFQETVAQDPQIPATSRHQLVGRDFVQAQPEAGVSRGSAPAADQVRLSIYRFFNLLIMSIFRAAKEKKKVATNVKKAEKTKVGFVDVSCSIDYL